MDFSFFELLQLNDATFPIGSYTFSWGLETFVQQGIIHDSKSAEAFIGSELSGSFLYSDLLAVRLAWEASGVCGAGELHCASGVDSAGAAHCASGVGNEGEMHCASSVGCVGETDCASGVGKAEAADCASDVCGAGELHCASGVGNAGETHCASGVGSAGEAHCASGIGNAGEMHCASGVGSASEAHCASGVGSVGEMYCASGVGSAGEAHCASGVGNVGAVHCASGVGSAGEMHCASGVGSAGEMHCASGVGSAGEMHCASGVGSAGEMHCASGVGSAGEMHSASGVGSAGEMHCASSVGKANEAHSANCTGNAPEPNNASLVRTVPSWQKLQALDEIYGASRGPFELREGSRKLATRFEKTTDAFCEIPLLANGTHGENSTGRASEMHGAKTAAYQAVYFPVAYGAHCAERGIPLEECLAAFTYSQVSARVTTCVKLVPLSQSEGQRILYSLMKNFSDIVAKCFTLSENDLCRSSPGLDLRAMQHEYLYSRLYSN